MKLLGYMWLAATLVIYCALVLTIVGMIYGVLLGNRLLDL